MTSAPASRPLEVSVAQNSLNVSSKWTDRIGIQLARVAGGMKRGLGIGRPSLTILNAASDTRPPPPPSGGDAATEPSLAQLGLQLQRAALALIGEFVTTGGDGVSLVDYGAMRSSEAFAAYLKLTDQLRASALQSPAAIGGIDTQRAFWLNLYAPLAAPPATLRCLER
jgi:hypothetical protein